MEELDIVFNIDYPSEDSIGPLHADLPKYVEYICVNDMNQFRRLINVLKDNTVCYIWVHPSLNSIRVNKGMKSDVEVHTIPELNRLNIKYKKITRSSQKSDNKEIFDTNEMLEFKKGMQKYTVRELHRILFPPSKIQDNSSIRHRLRESFSLDIQKANNRLADIRKYLREGWENNEDKSWIFYLIPNVDNPVYNLFNSRYWQFPIQELGKFLVLSKLDNDLIDTSVTEVNDIIIFNYINQKWQIDLSFFNEVSGRFESMDQKGYSEKLMIATCLYVIHEAVHKIHNLDNNTVQGIGNFPRIIEEADYQADTIAVITELGFYIAQNSGIENLTVIQIGQKLLETIRIAIETTFSFNPVLEPLKQIQVRRVNRYLIWFWQYFRIQSLMKTVQSPDSFVNHVLTLFSVKPNIEITGPAITSNTNLDRTFYNLDDIRHKELLGVMLENNQIIRLPPTNDIDFHNFYSSMKESDFDKMLVFLNRVLSNYKNLFDFKI